MICKIEDKEVVIEKGATQAEGKYDYEAFVKDLKGISAAAPQGHREPRFGVLDLKYSSANGERNKICLVFWCFEQAPVGLKMKYAATLNTLKNTMNGVAVHHQANDDSDLTEAELIKKAEGSK
jgi:hypothetical protein